MNLCASSRRHNKVEDQNEFGEGCETVDSL